MRLTRILAALSLAAIAFAALPVTGGPSTDLAAQGHPAISSELPVPR